MHGNKQGQGEWEGGWELGTKEEAPTEPAAGAHRHLSMYETDMASAVLKTSVDPIAAQAILQHLKVFLSLTQIRDRQRGSRVLALSFLCDVRCHPGDRPRIASSRSQNTDDPRSDEDTFGCLSTLVTLC